MSLALARCGVGSRVAAPIGPIDQEPLCNAHTAYPGEAAPDVPKVHRRARVSTQVSHLQGSARSLPCNGGPSGKAAGLG